MKIIIILLVLFTFPSFVFATPQVIDCEGSLDQNSIITISGREFGVKETANPIVWEGWENQNYLDNWNQWPNGALHPAERSEDFSRTGDFSLKSWSEKIEGDDSANRESYVYSTYEPGVLDNKLFLSVYIRYDYGDHFCGQTGIPTPSGYQIKGIRLGTENPGPQSYPAIYNTVQTRCTEQYFSNPNWLPAAYVNINLDQVSGDSTYYTRAFGEQAPSWFWSDEKWQLYQWEIDRGTRNHADGFIRIISNSPDFSLPVQEVAYEDEIMFSTDIDGSMNTIMVGQWVDSGNQGNTTIYHDDLYIDNSWARVFICDSEFYDQCSFIEMQKPIYWSDEEIQIEFNKGIFSDEPMYLFVVDANGTVSGGYGPLTVEGNRSSIPEVDSIDKPSVVHGDTIIISGDNFGNKIPVEPALWDDFEDGSLDVQIERDDPIIGEFAYTSSAYYSEEISYSGNKAAKDDFPASNEGYWRGVSTFLNNSNTSKKAFLSFKFYFDSETDSSYGLESKFLRINAGQQSGGGYNPSKGLPNININTKWSGMQFETILNHGSSVQSNRCGTIIPGVPYPEGLNWAEEWHGMDMWGVIGDLGEQNGMVGVTWDGIYCQQLGETAVPLEGGDNYFNGYRHGAFTAVYTNNGGLFPDGAMYLDDVYADNTLSRVFIAESNNSENFGKHSMQIPRNSWEDNRIEIEANTAGFEPGTYYLFVVNSEGNFSNPLEILIAEENLVCGNNDCEINEDFFSCPSDCDASLNDLFEAATRFGSINGDLVYDSEYDLNNDDRINILDLLIIIYKMN